MVAGFRQKRADWHKVPISPQPCFTPFQSLPVFMQEVLEMNDFSRSRRSPETGLPTQTDLIGLAKKWLEDQRKHWPDHPDPRLRDQRDDDTVAAEMASQFREGYLRGARLSFSPAKKSGAIPRGATYLRFSCDNSNPRSLAQQLGNVLTRAQREGVFIPWEAVFADAAVSGTIASRRGYQMAKKAIVEESGLSVLFLDEIGRASRDLEEVLRLGRKIDQAGKRFLGATDGFDSAIPNNRIMLANQGMMQEWFVGQLREKVKRGMKDAFQQGKVIQNPCLGYRLEVVMGANGKPVTNSKGKPQKVQVIDEEQATLVREIFEMYAGGKRPEDIARELNERRAKGLRSWGRAQIMQILKRETYIGTEYYKKTSTVRDPETGRIEVKKHPRESWLVRDVSHLTIVPRELWDRVQARRLKAAEAFHRRKPNGPYRTEAYPTRLFQPRCGHCGNALWLGKSGKYATFHCTNGVESKRGCRLANYKAVNIIEKVLLHLVIRQFEKPGWVELLVEEANQALQAAASTLPPDTQKLSRQITQKEKACDRVLGMIETCPDGDVAKLQDRHSVLTQELNALKAELTRLNAGSLAPPPGEISLEEVKGMLADLPALLREATPEAAPYLAEIFQNLEMSCAKEVERGAWRATFRFNATALMVYLSRRGHCPSTPIWEYLKQRGWSIGEAPAEQLIHFSENMAQQRNEARLLHAQGVSMTELAKKYGVSWERVKGWLVEGYTEHRRLRYGRKRKKAG
jgi:DNA invertase Pin-like site-specific DNA recombinase